jgi:hypothetical protein
MAHAGAERWAELFEAQLDVLRYDLTSTYSEGEGEPIPKASMAAAGFALGLQASGGDASRVSAGL